MTQAFPHLSNHVLASLEMELKALLPHLRFVELPQGMVLYEAGGKISRVFLMRESSPCGEASKRRDD